MRNLTTLTAMSAFCAAAMLAGCSGSSSPSPVPTVVPTFTSSPSTSSPTTTPTGGPTVQPTTTPSTIPTASPTPTTPAAAATNANSCNLTGQPESQDISCTTVANTSTGNDPFTTYSGDYTAFGTNSTGGAPLISAKYYYRSAPAGITPSGTVIASGAFTLTDTPSVLTTTNDDLSFAFGQSNYGTSSAPIQSAGEPFTCSLYLNTRFLGSASAYTMASTSNGNTATTSECEAAYMGANPNLNYVAFITGNNNTFETAPNVYTWVVTTNSP